MSDYIPAVKVEKGELCESSVRSFGKSLLVRKVDDINPGQRDRAADALPYRRDFVEQWNGEKRGDNRLQDHRRRDDGGGQMPERVCERHVSDQLRDDSGGEEHKPRARVETNERVIQRAIDDEEREARPNADKPDVTD